MGQLFKNRGIPSVSMARPSHQRMYPDTLYSSRMDGVVVKASGNSYLVDYRPPSPRSTGSQMSRASRSSRMTTGTARYRSPSPGPPGVAFGSSQRVRVRVVCALSAHSQAWWGLWSVRPLVNHF